MRRTSRPPRGCATTPSSPFCWRSRRPAKSSDDRPHLAVPPSYCCCRLPPINTSDGKLHEIDITFVRQFVGPSPAPFWQRGRRNTHNGTTRGGASDWQLAEQGTPTPRGFRLSRGSHCFSSRRSRLSSTPVGRSSRRPAAAVIGDLGEAARAPRVCVRIEIKVNRHSYSHSRARLAATSETAKIAWKL